ncbi:type II secretion system F family protein [uncultured Methylobacterium sp.]|jgi:tight adherence protein B|uniref:type II secretion system F family protein n=1 Tax=uncultured Methylobacterium sp. TaxID=157278 RepID=UPI002639C9FF|nr:type II secretion system F family protein [uncultured Methylobacterium sp.]
MTGLDTALPAALTAIAVAATVYVALTALLPWGVRSGKRQQAVIAGRQKVAEKAQAVGRRDQLAKSLKDLDDREKKTRPSLELRLARAGLAVTPMQFRIAGGVGGLLVALAGVLATGSLYAGLGFGFAAGVGLPIWLLATLRKRRIARFIADLPDAMDVVVRGIRSGLPLSDCLRVIAREAAEPLRSEFRLVVEAQSIGVSLAEAAARLHERIPVPEANFFAIVIGIQQKSGGNLSEALGNLSRVLRERRRMADKVKAMSMEAKASAAIIASLPFVVALLCYLSSPDYIGLLWTTRVGQLALGASLLWMLAGVLVMRRMIDFEI